MHVGACSVGRVVDISLMGLLVLSRVRRRLGGRSFMCFSLVPCGASLSVPFCGAGPAERDA